jgi:hypothetical protein
VDVQCVAGEALTWMGAPRRVLEGMTATAAGARPYDPVRTAEILAVATAAVHMQGGVHHARDIAEQVERVWEDSADAASAASPTAVAMVAESLALSGDVDRAERYLRSAGEMLASVQLDGGAASSSVLCPESRLV